MTGLPVKYKRISRRTRLCRCRGIRKSVEAIHDGVSENFRLCRIMKGAVTVSQPIHYSDRYPTKYPPTTASFQVRRTEGAMPTGKSFSAFQKLWTPAPKRVRAIFGAGFILRKPGMDHLFINFSAVVAAVFGDFEPYRYCSLRSARGRDDLGEFAI
jgi:hypothetical protein